MPVSMPAVISFSLLRALGSVSQLLSLSPLYFVLSGCGRRGECCGLLRVSGPGRTVTSALDFSANLCYMYCEAGDLGTKASAHRFGG